MTRKAEPELGTTCGSKGTGLELAHLEPPGGVFGWDWNPTDPCLQSEPGPLAGYPDLLLTGICTRID